MDALKEIDVGRNLLLKHPFTMLVAGSTGSGKTVLIRKLLSDFRHITDFEAPVRVLWCFGVHQRLYEEPLPGVHLHYVKGFPESVDGCDVIVLDDLQSSAGDDKRLGDLFTRASHHKQITVIYVVQNLFHQSKEMRNVSLNCHYLLLLSSRRDRSQVARLASQLFPGQGGYFLDAYKKALDRDYGYLLVDLTPSTLEENRLRTNILPEEYPIIIFRERDGV